MATEDSEAMKKTLVENVDSSKRSTKSTSLTCVTITESKYKSQSQIYRQQREPRKLAFELLEIDWKRHDSIRNCNFGCTVVSYIHVKAVELQWRSRFTYSRITFLKIQFYRLDQYNPTLGRYVLPFRISCFEPLPRPATSLHVRKCVVPCVLSWADSFVLTFCRRIWPTGGHRSFGLRQSGSSAGPQQRKEPKIGTQEPLETVTATPLEFQ